MPGYGYSYVSEKGYIAFLRDLAQPPWKAVSIKGFDVPDQVPVASLLNAPRPVVWKVRATWAIARVSQVLGGTSPEVLAELDQEWDSVQRKLYHFLGAAAEDSDPARRAAAGRLTATLLAGQGTAQTGWSYDDEVDFGWSQIKLVSEEGLAADAKKVGLGPLLKQIEKSTTALAEGLGRTDGQKRSQPRSVRLREALAECTSSFNAIHEEMLWMAEHTPVGPDRKLLEGLRAPFEALLSRFPPQAPAAKPEGAVGAPAPADPPAP